MKNQLILRAFASIFAGAFLIAAATPIQAMDSKTVKRLFADPPREYSTGPLWTWNDMLTEDQIVSTMRDLARQKVKQVWVHPRPGLMTPYLSKDWFRLWKTAVREAERLDMNVWIYDENSYPSGFAGGWVPELMPESRGSGLKFAESKTAPKWTDDIVAVYQITGENSENVSAIIRAGETLPAGKFLVASEVHAGNSPWFGNRCYVDLMKPGVTEKFLEITLEAYRRELGKQFGKRVPGVFTDEPNITRSGGLPWTPGLPKEFQKRWGYDLLEHLPSLNGHIGDWKRVRENYFQVLNEQFIEHWGKPYHDYCASNHLDWTGHYWEHEWPHCNGVPDNMAMYSWQQRPAIDTLMNRYSEDVHAQFGNARAGRELSSVANQLGLKRTLCEVYGAGGWDLRFEDMKRIGDWLQVLGVNTLDQHLSYVTIRGARKRDHPQSFSYHEPWWEAYHVSAEYLARLSAALSQGEQINSILVLEPTTSAWMYHCQPEPQLDQIGNTFQKLIFQLEAAQTEYDIGSEYVLAQHGSIAGAQLKVGQRNYSTIVLPTLMENLNSETMSLLEKFAANGGVILCCGDPPRRVDGAHSDRPTKLAANPAWKKVSDAQLVDALKGKASGCKIQRMENDGGILFHQRRQLDDGDLLFLVNTSITTNSAGIIESTQRGVERWDIETGKVEAYPFETSADGVRAHFKLPPSGSLLLFLSKTERKSAPSFKQMVATINAAAPPEIKRIAPNVLTIDYVNVTAGGESRSNLYCYQANQFAFQKNGMERNPWDSAVQFRDEIISKKFPANSGFEAQYRFVIRGAVPADLSIVIERPDLYSISCNGKGVAAKKESWWLDKAFGRIEIAKLACVGENVVTIKATPFTVFHELEPAYLLGDFSLEASDAGFVVVPNRNLALGKWNEQGAPFFSAGVRYRERFDLGSTDGTIVVSLPSWYGSVASVSVNGKAPKYISAPPWQCDVTDCARRGENSIDVTVIGTLKNTLGPHHGNPGLGAAWPSAFHEAPRSGPPPGKNYSTVGYGLFEPFVLKQITTEHSASR